jgi:hypothetical protein
MKARRQSVHGRISLGTFLTEEAMLGEDTLSQSDD